MARIFQTRRSTAHLQTTRLQHMQRRDEVDVGVVVGCTIPSYPVSFEYQRYDSTKVTLQLRGGRTPSSVVRNARFRHDLLVGTRRCTTRQAGREGLPVRHREPAQVPVGPARDPGQARRSAQEGFRPGRRGARPPHGRECERHDGGGGADAL